MSSSADEGAAIDDELRDYYLEEGQLQAPEVLRVIDIEATCLSEKVVLLDFWEQSEPREAYVAISHTYGMEVYEVFDCCCTAKFCSERVPPRCSRQPCPHETPGAAMEQRNRVVNDILRMCGILREAGVKYAWHDGVCIAQHDKEEVDATIQSMGWIYFAATETIVFLHYVGRPMAPIAPRGSSIYELTCRWHTRVWTVQEAALSRRRRYCVRVCSSSASGSSNFSFSPGECCNPEEFEQQVQEFEGKIGLWYRAESSTVDVISEWTLYGILNRLDKALGALRLGAERLHINSESSACVEKWSKCVDSLLVFLSFIMFDTYPTNPLYFRAALLECSLRDSKHVGDRINSILGLAEVQDLVVPKDDLPGMEAWTMEFFQRVQAEPGLALAVFCVNVSLEWSDRQYMRHSWVPVLWRQLEVELNTDLEAGEGISYRVWEEDGKLELRGKLICVAVKFTLVQVDQEDLPPLQNDTAAEVDHLLHAGNYQDLLIGDAHDQYLGINLIIRPQSTRAFSTATLSRAPTCNMGAAAFPTFRCEDGERCLNIGTDFVRMRDGESFQACLVFSLLSNNPIAPDRPTLIVHRQRRHRRRWCIQAWFLQLRRWCLQAWYLLLGRWCLHQRCCPQADLDLHDVDEAHVFKLGTFRMSDHFLRIASDPAHPASTIIEELVII